MKAAGKAEVPGGRRLQSDNAGAEADPEVGRTLRIRIVEDNDLMRSLLLAQISRWDIPVELSSSASGYHALIEIATSPPDVILTDLIMDGIDGFGLIETVRAQKALGRVKVAAITSLPPEEILRRGGLPAGVAYFRKPVHPQELRGYLWACKADIERTQVD